MVIDPRAPLHRLVAATTKAFRSAQPDNRGYQSTRHAECALDLHISGRALDRAIQIMNAVVTALGKLGIQVSFHKETRHAVAKILEQEIRFELIKKYNQIRIRENQQRNDFLAPKVRYEPNGILEFRITHIQYGQCALRDHKKQT